MPLICIGLCAGGVGSAEGRSLPFVGIEAPFTQQLYGVQSVQNGFGGVAFAANGDPLVDNCSAHGSPLFRFDASSTALAPDRTTALHPVTVESSNAGCGLANNPDGFLYSNTDNGVVRLDAATGAQLGAPFGPPGTGLGIATDPLTGGLVYVERDGTLGFVDSGLRTLRTFSTVTTGLSGVDQIAFDPSGRFLFASEDGDNRLVVLRRDGTLVQRIALTLGAGPDGVAFHETDPRFVLTNNNDGTITRFDFPGNDYGKPPTQTPFASGGFRGDNVAVGPDGCVYVTQKGTRYADGTTSGDNSLVRICQDFSSPPGVTLPPPGPGTAALKSAVVFVGGLGSTQRFADPAALQVSCAGGTWSLLAAGIAGSLAERYRVFDAPIDAGTRATPDCGAVEHHPPSEVHLDARDLVDQDANGGRLVALLGWLHREYGITDAWLVGQSAGGVWARSALTQLAAVGGPAVRVDGIITVGTPHTGSFGADLYSAAAISCATSRGSDGSALACAAAAAVRRTFGAEISGLTHAWLTGWNAAQTQQTTWGCIPVAAIEGTAYSLPPMPGLQARTTYASPNDGVVGVQSAAGTGPESSITRLIPLGGAPMVALTPPFGQPFPLETSSSVVANKILSTLSSVPPFQASCAGQGGSAADPTATNRRAPRRIQYTVPLVGLQRTRAGADAVGRLAPGTVLLTDAATTIACGAIPARTLPLLALSQFKIVVVPRCTRPLRVTFPRGHRRFGQIARSPVAATIRLVGHGHLQISTRGLGAGATLSFTLTGPHRYRRVVRDGQSALQVVARGRYQLELIARTHGVTRAADVPVNVS